MAASGKYAESFFCLYYKKLLILHIIRLFFSSSVNEKNSRFLLKRHCIGHVSQHPHSRKNFLLILRQNLRFPKKLLFPRNADYAIRFFIIINCLLI